MDGSGYLWCSEPFFCITALRNSGVAILTGVAGLVGMVVSL